MKIEIPRELAETVVEHMGKQYQSQEVRGLLRNISDALAEDPEETTVVETLTLQQRLYNWQLCNFGEARIELLKLGICEEVGELCHAVLKHEQGIRGFDDEAYYIEQASDAIADATIYLMQLCSAIGYELALIKISSSLSIVNAAKLCAGASGCIAVHESPGYIGNMRDALARAASVLGVDYESTVERVAEQVMKRDWTK